MCFELRAKEAVNLTAHLGGLEDFQGSLQVGELQVEVALVLMQLNEGGLLWVCLQLSCDCPSHQPLGSFPVQLLLPVAELGQLAAADMAPAPSSFRVK